MKKIFVLVLAVVLCLSMAACKFWGTPDVTEPGTEAPAVPTTEAATEETTEATEATEESTEATEETTETVPGTENEFVSSITYKGSPELIEAKDADGNDLLDCLVVVPVAEAEKLPEDKREVLEKVYEELVNGTMVLPYEKVEGIDADKMVIRELLEVYFVCDEEHKPEYVLTFDLGVEADDILVAMAYVEGEEDFEWVPAIEVINNGDGTVTFKFEKLCPIAISIEG